MQISRLPMVQIGKFQCLSHREFPEFFKTHPTLICRSIVQASRSLQTNRQCYLIALVECIQSVPCPVGPCYLNRLYNDLFRNFSGFFDRFSIEQIIKYHVNLTLTPIIVCHSNRKQIIEP